MKQLLLILSLFIYMNGDILSDKIENIIGKQKYMLHQKLIESQIENKNLFYTDVNGSINYQKLLEVLKDGGLLNDEFSEPQEIYLSFEIKGNKFKALKNLKQSMRLLGYSYFIPYNIIDNENYIVKIKYKSTVGFDPLLFVNEMGKINAHVISINKNNETNWEYIVDFNDAKTYDVIVVESNEKIQLRKPLKPYLLEIKDGKELIVMSHALNKWYPKIDFFDKDLQPINSIEKTRVYKGVRINIPDETKFIQLSDTYSLLNIKRGASLIVKN